MSRAAHEDLAAYLGEQLDGLQREGSITAPDRLEAVSILFVTELLARKLPPARVRAWAAELVDEVLATPALPELDDG